MSGLLVPDDWDEGQDGFCVIGLTVPNSPYWRANIKGQVYQLSSERMWDAQTGDAEAAAALAQTIYDSLEVVQCGLLANQAAYFPLSDVLDHIGDNDLTNVNGVSFVPGVVGNAASFSGSNHLQTSGLGITGSLTIAAYIRSDSIAGSRHMIASKYNFGNANQRAYRLAHESGDNTIQWIVSPDGSLNTSTNQVFSNSAVPLDEWHHVCAVFDGSAQELLIYIDGQFDVLKSVTYSTIYDSPAPFMIGATSQNNTPEQFFNGQIDELRVFERALSEEEIAMLIA